MLTLENVLKKGNMIYTDFFFVGNEIKGTAIYDISAGRVVEASYGDRNPLKDFIYGFGYVKKLLNMMVKADNYPEKVTFEWY